MSMNERIEKCAFADCDAPPCACLDVPVCYKHGAVEYADQRHLIAMGASQCCSECGTTLIYEGWGEDEYGPYQAQRCPKCSPVSASENQT